MTEDEMYEQIDEELHGGNLVRSLWTRVYAEVDGDEAKAKSKYIKARAEQLRGPSSTDKNTDQSEVEGINPDVLKASEIILSNISMTLLEKPFLLTKEQRSELDRYSEEARRVFDKQDPTIAFSLAGMSLSKGGAEKIFDLLDTNFKELAAATRDIPPKLTPNVSHKVFVNIETQGRLYLLIDTCRHRLRGGWAMPAKKREEIEEYNRKFDKQAWLTILYIKLSQLLLGTFSLR